MKQGVSYIVLTVCALLMDESALSVPLPDHSLSRRAFPSHGARGLSNVHSTSRDYSDAIYAGRFAQELDRLEKSQNDIFTDFIYAGFANEAVSRELPDNLKQLSRTPSLSHSSGALGFRFPEEGGHPINRPRDIVGSSQVTGFSSGPRRPFVPSRLHQGPVFSGGFRSTPPVRQVSDPDSFFPFSHRFGQF